MALKFTRYPDYKNLNLPWMKQIPAHWQVRKMKYLFSERVQKGFPDEGLLTATQSRGVILKAQYENRTVTAQKDLHLLKLVEIGDYVISLRSFQGGIEYAYNRGIISPAYTILRSGPDVVDGYFRMFLKSAGFIEGLQFFVTGIREGQNIDYGRLSRALLPVPPRNEQEVIGRFLSAKLSKVNRVLQVKRRTAVLLGEQVQATIHRIVARGFDSAVRLRESHVDWLGEIPAHWEVRRLKFAARIIYGISPHHSTYNVEGRGTVLINGPEEYSVEDFGLTRSLKWTTAPSKFAPQGALLFCLRGSTTGRLNLCHADVSIGRGVAALIPHGNPLYFVYTMMALRAHLRMAFRGSTFPSVTSNQLNNYYVPIPPLVEQVELAEHIAKVTGPLNDAIERTYREIELIEEYRTRLIADVISGAVDVRSIVIEDTAEPSDWNGDPESDDPTEAEEELEDEAED